MHIAISDLKERLIDSGFVAESDFDNAISEAERSNRNIPDILIGNGYITENIFLEIVQPYYNVPIININRINIKKEVLYLVPENIAKSKRIILFDVDNNNKIAKLAMVDPFDYGSRAYVSQLVNFSVEPYLMSLSSFHYGLKQYEPTFGIDFREEIKEKAKDAEMEVGTSLIAKATSSSIVTILDKIIDNAVTRNASDIHFEPLKDMLLVRFRIDGVLSVIVELPPELTPSLVARVKVLAGLAIDEHRVPQDGRFRFESGGGVGTDVRVNIIPVLHGEKTEMRLLKQTARPLSLSELGLSSGAIKTLEEQAHKPHGMILVTGPTGHGKTTTLYALLQILNTPDVNITTIEDPVEYEFPRINQTQVNTKAGVTFANGLRSLLRQNPDIIMIGEIRDNETVEISIHAALTGHRVLSSLHTNDSPSAISRLIDMGAEPFLLSTTINVIVAQRLVRKVCSTCVESYKADVKINSIIKEELVSRNETHITNLPQTLYRGKGCDVCLNSGYLGQMGIYEVFPITDEVRQMILDGADSSKLRAKAIKDGMVTMFEDGLQKVEFGATTVDEVLRVARE
jgi:type IV pilus assembly protein PilB